MWNHCRHSFCMSSALCQLSVGRIQSTLNIVHYGNNLHLPITVPIRFQAISHHEWITSVLWGRQDFVTGGSEVWVYRRSRVRSPPVPVVLSVYQRGSLLDGLVMYFSCDTKKFHDNESTHILHNFWTSTHRGEASPVPSLAAPLSPCALTYTVSR